MLMLLLEGSNYVCVSWLILFIHLSFYRALDNAAEIHNKANANPDEVIPTAPPMKSSRSTDLTSTSQQTDNKDSGQAKSAETTPEKDAAK